MTAEGRIILVRHGQTYSNVERLLDTRPPGAELTDLGREQARAVGQELAEYCGVTRGSLGRIAEVLCGISLRTRQTAALVASALTDAAGLPADRLKVRTVTGIHEIAAGEMEMRNDAAAHLAYAEAMSGWLHGDPAARMRGELGEILARYRPVLDELTSVLADGKDCIIFSHGAVIRTVATHATGVDPDFALANYVPNCRFVVLAPRGRAFGEWELVRWADAALP